jgi:GTP-binding protein
VLSITRLQAGGGEVKLFSALKKQGVDEVAQLLWQWSHPVQPDVQEATDATAPSVASGSSTENGIQNSP